MLSEVKRMQNQMSINNFNFWKIIFFFTSCPRLAQNVSVTHFWGYDSQVENRCCRAVVPTFL